jgi:putative PIN family toxin of toxin-antitoxin system
VLAALREGQFTPVLSPELLAELHDVLFRERIRTRWRLSPDDVDELLALFHELAIEAHPTGRLHVCRDPEDDFLIETALLTGTEIIVSRDDDLKRDLQLLAWAREHGIEVLSVAQFLERLPGPQA